MQGVTPTSMHKFHKWATSASSTDGKAAQSRYVTPIRLFQKYMIYLFFAFDEILLSYTQLFQCSAVTYPDSHNK